MMMRGGGGGRPQHGPMVMMKGDRARNFKGTMKKLLAYMGAYRLTLVVVLVFAIGSTVFTIIGPRILGNATT